MPESPFQAQISGALSPDTTYAVSFQTIDAAIAQRDAVLREAAQLLRRTDIPEPEPVAWGEVSLQYHEIPARYHWYSANERLDKTEVLANKIVRFVKQNNLYGQIQMYDQKQDKPQSIQPLVVHDLLNLPQKMVFRYQCIQSYNNWLAPCVTSPAFHKNTPVSSNYRRNEGGWAVFAPLLM